MLVGQNSVIHRAKSNGSKAPAGKFSNLMDIDPETFEPWQIQRLPTTYVVGPDGRIHFGAIGDRDWNSAQILHDPPPKATLPRKRTD